MMGPMSGVAGCSTIRWQSLGSVDPKSLIYIVARVCDQSVLAGRTRRPASLPNLCACCVSNLTLSKLAGI